MDLSKLDKGLLYTDARNCIGCNNCIRECPILAANVTIEDAHGSTTHLDDRECILCGTCLDTCTHNVRLFKDDCDSFLAALGQGRKISMLIAPAFLLNYPDEYEHILGYLRSIGVNKFYSVSFGADITTWAYLNYIQTNDAAGQISQPCPVIVSYIEKHQTNLLDSIIPIQSPMMCTAIYLKRHMGVTDELAFLSPCIAKKIEIESQRGQGLIKYNVTFNNLMKTIRAKGVRVKSIPPISDEIDYGTGSLYPVPGGLRENVELYMGQDAMVIQVEGEGHVYGYLRNLPSWVKRSKPIPTLIDALNCGRGCNYGTGTEFRHTNNDFVKVESYNLRKKKYKEFVDAGGQVVHDAAVRLAQLNEKFKHLNMSDFTCRYENKLIPKRHISSDEINRVWADMLKVDESSHHVDCRSCGYNTCEQMITAIIMGINFRENCVEYVKAKLNEQMVFQTAVLENATAVNAMLAELNQNNVAKISNDTDNINNQVDGAVSGGAKMRNALQGVESEFKKLTTMYDEIIKIARSTTILSINANIQAAQAGQHGKAFGVVAQEMGDLAKKIMSAAEQNQHNNTSIFKVLRQLVENTNVLIAQIDNIKSSTGEITINVDEITGKTKEILELMETLKK